MKIPEAMKTIVFFTFSICANWCDKSHTEYRILYVYLFHWPNVTLHMFYVKWLGFKYDDIGIGDSIQCTKCRKDDIVFSSLLFSLSFFFSFLLCRLLKASLKPLKAIMNRNKNQTFHFSYKSVNVTSCSIITTHSIQTRKNNRYTYLNKMNNNHNDNNNK